MIGNPFNKFHRKVGSTIGSGSRVEHTGNIGVIHDGERLPFRLKTGEHDLAIHAWLDQLKRDSPRNGFELVRDPNLAHASFIDHSRAAYKRQMRSPARANDA